MKKYIAEIKEVGNPSVLTPSLTCEGMTEEGLVRFWGLEKPDVEWYRLYEVVNGQKFELKSKT